MEDGEDGQVLGGGGRGVKGQPGGKQGEEAPSDALSRGWKLRQVSPLWHILPCRD